MSNHVNSYKVRNTACSVISAQYDMKVHVHLLSILFHQDISCTARTSEEANLRLNVHLTSSFTVCFMSVIRNPSRFKYFSDSTLSNFYYSFQESQLRKHLY